MKIALNVVAEPVAGLEVLRHRCSGRNRARALQAKVSRSEVVKVAVGAYPVPETNRNC